MTYSADWPFLFLLDFCSLVNVANVCNENQIHNPDNKYSSRIVCTLEATMKIVTISIKSSQSGLSPSYVYFLWKNGHATQNLVTLARNKNSESVDGNRLIIKKCNPSSW